jgi:hypothetical protein
MDGRYIEPRRILWAVAEVIGQDADGTSFRVPGTLEDTSTSGACIRIRRPMAVGSWITVKWQREQFAAVAKNCRSDGRDFLLGVRRATENALHSSPSRPAALQARPAAVTAAAPKSTPRHPNSSEHPPLPIPHESFKTLAAAPQISLPDQRNTTQNQGTSPRPERKVMQPKTIFPHFWRRKPDGGQQDEDASTKSMTTEAPMNKSMQEPTPSGPRGELLTYEDIYRAAGIMSPGSGYGIHKVVDMLNNERIRDLAKDVKRSSVLMAFDAAGISADELLTDATRRQNALTAYEAAQVKQLEEFEARKAKENSRIEEEMEKVRVHYAQRVQANLDQVAKEKEALRNWQMAMQHETQRIGEVIELCGKQSAPPAVEKATAAAAGAQASEKSEAPAPLRPTLLGES